MDEQIKELKDQIERLKEKIEKLKKYAVIESVIGAVITTIFAVCNNIRIAAIIFVVTLIVSFSIDLTKKILTLMIFKKNRRRNNLIVQEQLK